MEPRSRGSRPGLLFVWVGSGLPFLYPGEGRGPVLKVAVTERIAPPLRRPNWAPAFAGVQGRGGRADTPYI